MHQIRQPEQIERHRRRLGSRKDEARQGENKIVPARTGKHWINRENLKNHNNEKFFQRELQDCSNFSRKAQIPSRGCEFSKNIRIYSIFLTKFRILQQKKLYKSKNYCFFLFQPQQSLPDIFLWVISSGKRVAYHRISARDVIYSIVDEESGRFCATVQNVYLKVKKRSRNKKMQK